MQSGEFYEQILATLDEGLFVVGSDGKIILCNEAFERMTGYSRGECVGASCEILGCDMCAKSRAGGGPEWCTVFHSTAMTRKLCAFRRKDGSWLPAIKNARALRLSDRVCVVETITDISKQAEREEPLAAYASKAEAALEMEGMVGQSAPMRRLFRLLERAAASDAPVLLLGESGTGKELAAHALHRMSARYRHPYVSVNCTAFNESVLESELFGHVRGAFTGAVCDREGRFAAAHTGTLFLDEVGDMPLPMQAKLLRVLETGTYEAVGSTRPCQTDVRLVTATNRPLEYLVRQGLFREDLFFRIHVIPIQLPPLKERREDIPLLAAHLLESIRKRANLPSASITDEALAVLMSHSWPGNVRELRNVLEYALVLAGSSPIEPQHLPALIGWIGASAGRGAEDSGGCLSCRSMEEPGSADRNSPEKQAVLEALRQCGGSVTRAAGRLGIHRTTLHARMRRLGITRGCF